MNFKPRVLVIDDNPEDVYLLSMHLQRAGCEVRSAPDLKWGLHVAKAEPCDIVLLDNRFGNSAETGIDFLREFAALCSAGVILITAFADERTERDAKAMGASAFLTKPVDVEHLLAAIARLSASRAEPARA